MGNLYYGWDTAPIPMSDHVLAHLKVLTTAKLRRSEGFTISWQHTDDQAPGRTTIWMQASIPLRFVFDSTEAEALDPQWLKELSRAANAGGVNLSASQIGAAEPLQALTNGA